MGIPDLAHTLSSELCATILDRANGLKGRYFDAMELCRMGMLEEVRSPRPRCSTPKSGRNGGVHHLNPWERVNLNLARAHRAVPLR